MDIKQLITEIENYPEIWNPKHNMYHHRPRISTIWNEISTKTGLPSNYKRFKSEIHFKYSDMFFLQQILAQFSPFSALIL